MMFKMPGGLLDNLPAWAKKGAAGFVILGLMGIFVAMCVAPNQDPIFEDYGAVTGADLNQFRADICWVLASAAVVFLMTPGIAFFYGGMISTKNVVATIAACIIPMALIPIMWACIGYSLAFGKSAGYPDFIGTVTSYGLMYNMGAAPSGGITTTTVWMFQCVFAMITPAILVGSIADRVNFPSLLLFIPLWHMGVYCPAAHMVWGLGRISQYGVIDFAGGIVVHMSSGWGALAAAFFLGRSKVKSNEGPSSLPYVVIGAAFLWFGWFGFNAGSALGANWQAAHAFVNTNMAAAFAMFTWMIMDQLLGRSFRVTGMAMGIVVGLVGITPAAGYVNYGAAAIIGMVTAIACQLVQAGMEKWGAILVSDTLSVFACHGIGGTVGMLMTSVFQAEAYGAGEGLNGAWYGQGKELGKCLVVLFCIAGYFLVATYIIMFITNLFISMRVTEEEEEEGLDFSKHYEGPVAESVVSEAY
ncbi:hypothetical protein FOA52_008359 [Chlamydomonas sp. UWO 241]|nr:hypothetical protein FOA52_008359 [Chlamydomonas sp. UWO 241]